MKLLLWQIERFFIRSARFLFGAVIGVVSLYCFGKTWQILNTPFPELTLAMLISVIAFSIGGALSLVGGFAIAFGDGPSEKEIADRGIVVPTKCAEAPPREKHFYEKNIDFPLSVLAVPIFLTLSVIGFTAAWGSLEKGEAIAEPLFHGVGYMAATVFSFWLARKHIKSRKK